MASTEGEYLAQHPALDGVPRRTRLLARLLAHLPRHLHRYPALGTLPVHGHCHQEALGAMKSMRKPLKAIPDLNFKRLDASGRGMAARFGIEQEHAELGMRMAEQDPLPEPRAHPDSPILAHGFSCRHPIEPAVDRPAMPIASLLNEALA